MQQNPKTSNSNQQQPNDNAQKYQNPFLFRCIGMYHKIISPFSVSIAQRKKSVKQAAFVEKIAALLAFPPQICYTNHIDFVF